MSSEQKTQMHELIAHGQDALHRWEGEKAQECFQQVIALLPSFLKSGLSLKEYRLFQMELIPAYCGLARAFQQVGKPAEAINYLLHAFKIAPQDRLVQQTFASVACCMEVQEYHQPLAEAVITLLHSSQVNPQDLALLGWSVWKSSTHPLKENEDLLLHSLLRKTIIPKQEFEAFFIALRKGVLNRAVQSEDLHGSKELLEAIVAHVRLTEFIYPVTEEEKQALSLLKDHTIVTAYEPNAIQIDPFEANIPIFGTIRDRVSQSVEKQYEENPYPQWVQIAPIASKPLPQVMGELFPFRAWGELPEKPSILIAGCGTGSHAAKTAYRIQHKDLLAIDLSRSSLIYAEKKMRELSLHGIEYVQMDLLELVSYGKTFDVIESVGVLHHMDKPIEGLRALKGCLKKNGVMNIGLYSTLAREDVREARKLLNWQGESVTPDLIKAARQKLYALPEGELAREVTKSLDFFSVSGVRDLLFNIQEHTFTISEIREMLCEVGLKWIGFEWWHPQWPRRYRQQYPEDLEMHSMDMWNLFEKENPQTFLAMYNFWVE